MTLEPAKNYRKWLLPGLLLQVLAAWFSIGYHHPDEYHQVLEFCNYKLGRSAPADMGWEFLAQCRSALLPFIAFLLSKGLITLHLFHPTTVTFILRLGMGLFTWLVSCQLIKLLLPQFTTRKAQDLFVLLSMFLWYVPYIGVRFSAENVAGLLFFQSVLLLLRSDDVTTAKRAGMLLLAGLLMAIATFVRLQMAFAILGLGIWMLFLKRYQWSTYLLMIPGAIVGLALCLVADRWFYGSFVLTPYNYYVVNITNNIAAQWGIFPWWYYVQLFLLYAIIPISIALLLLFAIGMRKRSLHLFSIICICFIIGHSLIGHKEMRFLFPINMAFLFMVCQGADALIIRYGTKPAIRNTFKFLAVINIIMLVYRTITPAHEAFLCYTYLYNLPAKNTMLWSLKESPYCLNGNAVNFYKPKDLDIYVAQDLPEIARALNADKEHTMFLSKTVLPAQTIQQYHLKQVYCIFPKFVLLFNINNWVERSSIWAVYKAG